MVRAPRRAYSSLGEHLILHSHADLGQEQESACCHLHELFIYKISGCYCPAPWLAARQRLLTHGSAQHLPLQPGSCQLPQDPIPPQLSTGHCIFAAKIPLTSFFFFFLSSSSSPCLLRNGSSAAVKPGAGALSHFSSLPLVCATQGGEKAEFQNSP